MTKYRSRASLRPPVTRPTFYQHFSGVADAARKIALARLASAFPIPDPLPLKFDFSRESFAERTVSDALSVIRYMGEDRIFYLRVLNGAGDAKFFEDILAFTSARMLPEAFESAIRKNSATMQDITTVVAGGIILLMIGWLRDEVPEEPRSLAKTDCSRHLVGGCTRCGLISKTAAFRSRDGAGHAQSLFSGK